MTDEQQDGLLNEEQAATYLGGLPVATVKALVRRKEIAHVRVTRGVYAFKREHLDAYIDAHTIQVVENPWGLTDGALRHIREGRVTRTAS